MWLVYIFLSLAKYNLLMEIQSNLRRKKLHRLNYGSNFLGGGFSNRENLRAPVQFRRVSQPQHLKRRFFLRIDASIFISYSTSVIRPVKSSWVFPALKSTSHFLPQLTVSRRSDSSSEANSSFCHRSDAWSHLE